mmetsp:Transcript_2019/g.4098  ORF Transcript_2019/g.4098 Transcript_2019/m.4098 type:complete len:235 (-) Transcript_2019:468-1172(-)
MPLPAMPSTPLSVSRGSSSGGGGSGKLPCSSQPLPALPPPPSLLLLSTAPLLGESDTDDADGGVEARMMSMHRAGFISAVAVVGASSVVVFLARIVGERHGADFTSRGGDNAAGEQPPTTTPKLSTPTSPPAFSSPKLLTETLSSSSVFRVALLLSVMSPSSGDVFPTNVLAGLLLLLLCLPTPSLSFSATSFSCFFVSTSSASTELPPLLPLPPKLIKPLPQPPSPPPSSLSS